MSCAASTPRRVARASRCVWKSRDALSANGIGLIAIGFVTAFVVALPVVRGLIGFVGRHGLVPFAWYRIVVGLGWAAWLFYRG